MLGLAGGAACYPRGLFLVYNLPRVMSTLQQLCLQSGRPRSIHHVSGREVDVGEEGPIFKNMCTKLESEFLTGQDHSRVLL